MTKIFCDIADIKIIKKFNNKKIVKGFTTNPSLMSNDRDCERVPRVDEHSHPLETALNESPYHLKKHEMIQARILKENINTQSFSMLQTLQLSPNVPEARERQRRVPQE